MRQIIALAKKDLRLMPRDKGGMFFTFAWPIVLMVLFGFAFGGRGPGDGAAKIRLAVVDEDRSPAAADAIRACGMEPKARACSTSRHRNAR